MPRGFGILFAFVLLLRLPFLNMPVQGDDVYYLAQAEHAQIDPLHPADVRYVFQGVEVDLRGHPHPPFNAWFLGLLLALWKDVYVGWFHLVYIGFSLLAAASVWSIAKRFTPHPLAATLLFLVTPAFVINGNSFETDVPFTAFWLASIAAFLKGLENRRWLWISAIPMALAALTAYQAIVLTPVLWLLVWLRARRNAAAWALTLVPPLVVGAYQVYESTGTGAMPVGMLAHYLQTYGYQQFMNKVRNAAGLSVHLLWIVFPPLLWFYFRNRAKYRDAFLEGWIAIFFVAALALFYAGAARYLLPIAAPIAILVSRPGRWLAPAIGTYLVLGLALTFTTFQHWEAYRQFAKEVSNKAKGRVWVNGEWGLRYYLESEGALPVRKGQAVHPGEVIVTSRLAFPLSITTGGGRLTPIAFKRVIPALPLQTVGLHARSGYSTVAMGYLPFGITRAPIDEIEAQMVLQLDPKLSSVKMNAPDAPEQLISGFYELEQDTWRWMSGQGAILLKSPSEPRGVFAAFYIPDNAPGRTVRLVLDGKEVARQTYSGPGQYTLQSQSPQTGSTLLIEIDKTISPVGDNRQLGLIVTEAGYLDALSK